jgi:5-deoxy-glucuronate isomerase
MSHPLRLPTPPDAAGRVLSAGIAAGDPQLHHVGLEAYRLTAGRILSRDRSAREAGLVLLGGVGILAADGLPARRVGGRTSPFDGPGFAAYLPAGCAWQFTAETACDIALCLAPGAPGGTPRVIAPGAIRCSTRGQGQHFRQIRDVLPETEPAHALLLVEVITPGGHWSSFPPHKHDRDAPPAESRLEEIYYHRFRDPRGFGFQRIYTEDGADTALTLTDGAAVLVPSGYHPVAAAPGYDLYYLNVMAGPTRAWRVRHDPAHAWIGI